jgi:hypothetical protein
MALSQYVAINFLTKFDKKGLERATKELKGFDKVVATGAFRLKTFAKAGGIAAAAGMALFAKNSIQAALAQEQLDKSLKLTLNSIGKGALSAEVSQFIEGLQSLTNVTEEQLVPALQQLISQTGDLEASQALLTLALDVSAGTGKDLSTTLDAITKAAVGNYKSIGTLGIGYTAAQAKTMGFAKTMQVLQKYTGAAEEATLTFGGQIKSFKISAGEATETLGTGFLNAYAIISGGQPLIKGLGDDLEVAAKQFSNIFVGIAAATKEKGLGIYADLAKVAVEGLVGESGTLQRLEKTGMKFLNTEKETSNQREDRVKTTKKILTFDEIIADIQKKILATEKLTTKEKAAQQALDKKKAEISAMFDIDRINLQVALSRKLSAEDELRVKILQKLADGTKVAVDEAQRYVDVLKVIEDGQITTAEVEMLAKKWGITTAEVLIYLRILFSANDELRKMLALMDELSKKKFPKPEVSTDISTFSPSIQQAILSGANAIDYGEQVRKNLVKELGKMDPTGSGAAASGRLSAQAVDYYQKLLDIPRMAEGGIVNSPTLAMIGEAGAEAVVPLDKMGGMGTTVNINVAGSVISEGQLQSVIQDALYNLNRSGAVTQLTNLGR